VFHLSWRSLLPFVIIMPAAVLFTGCDSTEIDPFQNDGRYFSVYGFLNDVDNRQAVRVVPVRRSPERIGAPHDPHADIDARVTTTDTLTGQVVHWNHVLTQLSDGTYGHVFRANINILAGRTYRLDVVREDGRSASAMTTVPAVLSTRALPAEPVALSDTTIFQDIFLPGIHSPWNVRVVYYFPDRAPMRIDYGRPGEAVEGEGWSFRVDFHRDVALMLEAFQTATVSEIEWDAMGVELLALDRNWDPPGDVFDPEILAQPSSLSNVENGYGYFGSTALFQDSWPNSGALDALFGFSP